MLDMVKTHKIENSFLETLLRRHTLGVISLVLLFLFSPFPFFQSSPDVSIGKDWLCQCWGGCHLRHLISTKIYIDEFEKGIREIFFFHFWEVLKNV